MTDMPDLDGRTVSEFAENLRGYDDYDTNLDQHCKAAADVIDALQAENERLRGMLSASLDDKTITPDAILHSDDWTQWLAGDAPLIDLARLRASEAENERLRAELSQIKASYKVANKPWAI